MSDEIEVPQVEPSEEEVNVNFIGIKVFCSSSHGELDIVIAKPPDMDVPELEYIIGQLHRSLQNNLKSRMYDNLSAKIPRTPVEEG